ncbi:MAG: glycosyltransferase [Kiritimatiellae bacterium]|nr:glycosyltransferase [Kiritimatiellia bacterium]
MKSSIIINTCNRAEHLKRLLPGLLHLVDVEMEIVVVNGPSTDDSLSVLDQYAAQIKVAHCPVMNLSVSRNIGIAAASGDVLVFIDDDAVPGSGLWLKRYVDAFESDPQLGGAAGSVLAYDSNDYEYTGGATTAYAFQRFDSLDANAPSPDGRPWIERGQGCNCAFRRSALAAIGGYDERFRFWLDETDVFFRLHQAGFTYRFLMENPVRHYPTRTQFKMGLPPDKWATITRSDTCFSLKNSDDLLPLRLFNTLRFAPNKYYCRIIRDYTKRGLLSFAERLALRRHWMQGLLAGLYLGLFTRRRTTTFDPAPMSFKMAANPNPAAKRCIALLTTDIPSHPGCGGIGRYTFDLAKGLHHLGHEVHILCRDTRPLHHESLDFFIHGISEEEIGRWNPMSSHPELNHNLCYGLAIQHRLDRLALAGISFDIIHATNWNAEALAVIQAGKTPVSLTLVTSLAADVVEMQWNYDDEKRACIATDHWQVLHAAQLCAPTRGVLESYRTLMNIPEERLAEVAIVPLGIVPRQMTEPIKSGPFKTLLFVGRCERRKGIHVLLEILPDLLEKHPDWQCILIGNDTIPDTDGQPFKDRFQKTCPPHLAARVTFKGVCTEEEMHRAYQQCDLFVAPSLFESFGLIYLEAMQYGKAVVGCVTGGVPEVVRDGIDGLLTPPGDAPALLNALNRLMTDDAERGHMGRAGRERVLSEFTHTHMAERFLAAYEKILFAPIPTS